MAGPGKARGGRAASNSARSTRPQPTPVTSGHPPASNHNSSRTTRATTARKRQGADDEEPLPPKPAKNPRKNAETVDTTPLISNAAPSHNTTNSPATYLSPGLSTGHGAFPAHANVHIDSSRLLAQPGFPASRHLQVPGQYPQHMLGPSPATSHHLSGLSPVMSHHHPGPQLATSYHLPGQSHAQYAYPQHWSGAQSGPHPTVLSPHRPQPPPYQSPPPDIVVIDNDFSDGEDPEVEFAERFCGEVEESTGVQFNEPARGHQPAPPALVPPPSQPAPVQQIPVAPIIPAVVEEPYQEPRPLTLPTPNPDDPPLPRSWYPKPWQHLIDHAQGYMLHYMAFFDPFPNGTSSHIRAREDITMAFSTYNMVYDDLLDVTSFNEHRQNFATLAMKGARSHRGRYRTAVLKALYDTKEFGLTQKTPAASIVNRVESLLHDNCYLDVAFPSPCSRTPGSSMYKSPILKKAIHILYTTEPWRTAISQPWLVDVEDYDGAFRAFPPVGFVAFAACAFRNILDSLVSGMEENIPFSEAGYSPTYEFLADLIRFDMDEPDTGLLVVNNIQALIADHERPTIVPPSYVVYQNYHRVPHRAYRFDHCRVPHRPSRTVSTIAYHIDHRVPRQPSRTTSTIAYRRQPLRTTVNRRIPPGTMKVPESAGYPRVPPGVIALTAGVIAKDFVLLPGRRKLGELDGLMYDPLEADVQIERDATSRKQG
ncbi:hypothetical protein BJ322DRAFT_1021176 [Thelephora terrestris]|uniref:DUF6532 domain-containing protein n=1 Tax=Thelephora terrestris TaxID=56493 RepID=A0A9P6L6I4_9AGAM|nr:hypothetical protein BJ322DRAFT_1021176 [Thelephora terrestris]